MYTVASPDSNPTGVGGGVNYLTLTSAMRGETITPNPNECNSTTELAGTQPLYTKEGGQLPNPNECNSTLTSVSSVGVYTNDWN